MNCFEGKIILYSSLNLCPNTVPNIQEIFNTCLMKKFLLGAVGTNFSIVFCLVAKKNLAPYQLVLVKQMALFTIQLSVFVYLHEFSSTALG